MQCKSNYIWTARSHLGLTSESKSYLIFCHFMTICNLFCVKFCFQNDTVAILQSEKLFSLKLKLLVFFFFNWDQLQLSEKHIHLYYTRYFIKINANTQMTQSHLCYDVFSFQIKTQCIFWICIHVFQIIIHLTHTTKLNSTTI